MLPSGLDLSTRPTLQNISCTVSPGEWVTLLGSNGSGKSTLARLSNGLLLPNDGEVKANGISSWQHNKLMELRKTVGLVTQDPDNQMVSTTVFDEVAFGPQNLGWPAERIYELVPKLLAQVGLSAEEFAKRDPNTLSGGEKQRVVIAAILAMEPAYLVLDEPTAMLDPISRAQVLEAIHTAVQKGHGVLHITHLLKEASFSHRVLVLNEGKLVYDGPPATILEDREALLHYGLLAEPAVRGPLLTREQREQAPQVLSLQVEESETSSPESTPIELKEKENRFLRYSSLEINELSYAYPQSSASTPVLENFNLTLHAGECVLLVGASGSGKSTLLSLAAGLLPASSGTVSLLDDQGGAKTPEPGEVGLVFQHPEGQLFAQTVEEDILFGPKNLGLLDKTAASSPNASETLVNNMLKAVGLEPARFAKRSPYSLSGGEARRVAIATTLALQTRFLLLDEPTAGLDARGKVFIYELLQQLLAAGSGIILATHDPSFFADLATSKIELKKTADNRGASETQAGSGAQVAQETQAGGGAQGVQDARNAQATQGEAC